MAGKWAADYSFVTGSARSDTLALLVMARDDVSARNVQHFFHIGWNAGEWQSWDPVDMREWEPVSICFCNRPMAQWLILGSAGQVLCVGSGDVHEESLAAGNDRGVLRGALRQVNAIDGEAYAVGIAGQVFKRTDVNVWQALDNGMPSYDGEADEAWPVGLEAIGGYSVAEMYAVGLGGHIWWYDGESWRAVKSPVDVPLTGVCCCPDGNVYVCGRRGTLVRGRYEHWETVQQSSTTDDFWGMAWFNDALYLSTLSWVYHHLPSNGAVAPIEFGTDVPSSCFHLSTAGNQLWSIGRKDLMSFNGRAWIRID